LARQPWANPAHAATHTRVDTNSAGYAFTVELRLEHNAEHGSAWRNPSDISSVPRQAGTRATARRRSPCPNPAPARAVI